MSAPARRDLAVLALVQAQLRLDKLTRELSMLGKLNLSGARGLLALIEVVRPMLIAMANMIPEKPAE